MAVNITIPSVVNYQVYRTNKKGEWAPVSAGFDTYEQAEAQLIISAKTIGFEALGLPFAVVKSTITYEPMLVKTFTLTTATDKLK